MTATSLDLSQIRTDALTSAATFRTLIGVYSSAEVDALASNYATAAQGTLADSALQPADITSGTITAGTGDIDFDDLGGGLSFFTESQATTSPNDTVYVSQFSATGATTNVDFVCTPKGSGAFIAGGVPDGTTTGGNKRGIYAVDMQLFRTAATQVASGSYAVVAGTSNTASANFSRAIGHNNTASGGVSIALGNSNIASSDVTTAIGSNNQATAANAVAIGNANTASTNSATALGSTNTVSGNASGAIGYLHNVSGWRSFASGFGCKADRAAQRTHANGYFSSQGDAQITDFTLRNKTTSATPVELFADGSSSRLTIPSGKLLAANVLVSGIKSDGSAVALYKRKVAIKNVGGTTSLVGSVETIGTDHEDNASTDVTITADNTNDSLKIEVTGIAAETWRWVAIVEGLEIGYGT